METVDVVIVGAGAVGLAVAARVADQRRTVLVLESHRRHGIETSSRNSEVVHAGITYPADSLKSRLCHAGRRWLYAHADAYGYFIKKTGKLIVAVDADEERRLADMCESARGAGAEGLELLSGAEAERRVPGLRARAALWSPESGIIDAEEFMAALRARAEKGGAMFLFATRLQAVARTADGYELSLAGGETVLARRVVNAAGLHGDAVAALAGIDIDKAGYRLHWCKGHYFRWRQAPALKHLVYPLPAADGLGIHLTLDRAGAVRLGPDTLFVSEIDYKIPEELKTTFAQAVARYMPSVGAAVLDADTAGIRPKLAGPGGGFRDFVVAEESAQGLPGWINCLGIESPGLTASPAIADFVAGMLD